jgi:hypothetical protein
LEILAASANKTGCTCENDCAFVYNVENIIRFYLIKNDFDNRLIQTNIKIIETIFIQIHKHINSLTTNMSSFSATKSSKESNTGYTSPIMDMEHFSTDKLKFSDPVINKKGGRTVYIQRVDGKPAYLLTPELYVPYGISEHTNADGHVTYKVTAYLNEELNGLFYNCLANTDQHIMQASSTNSLAWLKQKEIAQSFIDINYNPIVKVDMDDDGNRTNDISDKFTMKIPYMNNNTSCEFYDKDQKRIEYNNLKDVFPRKCNAKMLIEFKSIWFIGEKYGVTIELKQAQIFERDVSQQMISLETFKSDLFKCSNIKKTDEGGQFFGFSYGPYEDSFDFKIGPVVAPFGASVYTDESNKKKGDRLSIAVNLEEGDYQELINNLEAPIKEHVLKNSKILLKKAKIKDAEWEHIFKSPIKKYIDKTTGEATGKYPNQLNIKLPVYDNRPRFSLHGENNEKLLETYNSSEDILNVLSAKSVLDCTVRLKAAWAISGKIQVTFELVDAVVSSPTLRITGYQLGRVENNNTEKAIVEENQKNDSDAEMEEEEEEEEEEVEEEEEEVEED